ncbi:DNA-binding response regulator [Paenibacillus sp. CAA11]|uniref:response regulator n=1 Tax=Paenibacillus sp. CAA11 TaxID=1532905 RepID=UPI000D341CA6|nr:response regulator transcription factor [Paenibacillus sp. CAA11]AWB44748.1 DNA-binding response regulator [Paenibacillus sp. CAA11]
MSVIKVLIVDDHQLVRDGLKLIIETNKRFVIIGEAENGKVGLDLIDEMKPDVILLDLNMPVMSGMEVMEVLSNNQCDIPVIILTTYNEDDLMVNALALGAKGYLLKDTSRTHLFRTIESAVLGETLLQADMLPKVLAAKERNKLSKPKEAEFSVLTDKEKIILQFVARGYKSKEIAFDMGVTERTVKAHLTSIYTKLGVESRSQAVATAMERGIIHI